MTSAAAATDDLSSDLHRAERMVRSAVDGSAWSADREMACRYAALARCGAVFRLTATELDILLLALSVEVSPGVGALFAQLNGDPQRRRPTVASLLSVLSTSSCEPPTLATLGPGSHLVRSGLVELVGDGPFPDRTVRIPDIFWPRLAGLPVAPPFSVIMRPPGAVARLIVAPETRRQLAALVESARTRGPHAAVIGLYGRGDCGAETIATALASELGFAAIAIPAALADDPTATAALVREAAWNLAALVIDGAPSAQAITRLARETSTPLIVLAPDAAAVDGSMLGERWRADVEVDPLDTEGRATLWRELLTGVALASDVDLDALAARLVIGPRRIAAIAAAARRSADGRPISNRDLRIASRRGGAPDLAGLARRLDETATFDQLVVPLATRRELELALAWARGSARVFRSDGTGRRIRGRGGLVCLFHGPPGTGKTMAARVMAATIDADLLRVDLSQVVNKYIGETEKNLDRAFDEAEATGAVLFFDEADALFGKRSEVKDAHDRYANIETAFLLQRLEVHRGICILASNLRQNLDDAFTRRIHVSAEFPAPGRDERRRIWELQFPPECLARDVDLGMLADRAAISGGDIRNAAATAALLAADDDDTVAMQHLVIGTWRELRKSGRLVSADVFGAWKDVILEYARADAAAERSSRADPS